MTNPAIRRQPNGDVDIAVPAKQAPEGAQAESQPEPTVDPDRLDYPEGLLGE